MCGVGSRVSSSRQGRVLSPVTEYDVSGCMADA